VFSGAREASGWDCAHSTRHPAGRRGPQATSPPAPPRRHPRGPPPTGARVHGSCKGAARHRPRGCRRRRRGMGAETVSDLSRMHPVRTCVRASARACVHRARRRVVACLRCLAGRPGRLAPWAPRTAGACCAATGGACTAAAPMPDGMSCACAWACRRGHRGRADPKQAARPAASALPRTHTVGGGGGRP